MSCKISLCCYNNTVTFFWLVGQVVKTPPSQGGIRGSIPLRAVFLFVLLLLSMLLKADYGVVGFGYVVLIYILKDNRVFQVLLGICFLPSKWIGGLAFIPINLYNGKRGFIKGNIAKYFFYGFYPLHMICLYIIRRMIFGV